MQVQLTREEEQIVKQELKSGRFRTTEEVVAEALRALHEKHETHAAEDETAQRDRVRAMLRFVEENSVRLSGISVKELIHEGHHV